jgi:hypothetical protein
MLWAHQDINMKQMYHLNNDPVSRDKIKWLRRDPKTLTGWKEWQKFFKEQFNIKFIPDVREYTCLVGDWDEDFESIGVKRRTWRRAKIVPYKNRKYNKYLVYLFKCIWHNRFNEEKRHIYINRLLQSKIGFIAALQYVDSHWYSKPKSFIDKCWIRHKKNGNIMNPRVFETKRVYIPKGTSKWRPLGVPKLWERTSLHLLTKVLMFILADSIDPTQHGITTKGTNTAWREVLSKGINWENIYEYDLKGFFDNVNNLIASMMLVRSFWDTMSERARTYKMEIQSYFFELIKNNSYMTLGTLNKDPLFKFMTRINESRPKWPLKTSEEQLAGDIVRTREADKSGEYREKVLKDLVSGTLGHTRKGLPQGGPHSPLMSMMEKTMYHGKMPWEKYPLTNHIQYVDDGITDVEVRSNPESGTEIQPLKSGWVKRDGQWIKPLKFLGLVYNGLENAIAASTRNGASLRFEGPVLDLILKKLNLKELDWQKITSSKYWGWIMSRLYQDSWVDSKFSRRIWRIPYDSNFQPIWYKIAKYANRAELVGRVWTEEIEELEIEYKNIHSHSVNAYIIGRAKWTDPRNGEAIDMTNKSSVLCNLFLDRRGWKNIPVDPVNEYRRRYRMLQMDERMIPLIIRKNGIDANRRLFRDYKEFRKYLQKGNVPIRNMCSIISMELNKTKIFNTRKVRGIFIRRS